MKKNSINIKNLVGIIIIALLKWKWKLILFSFIKINFIIKVNTLFFTVVIDSLISKDLLV